MMLANTLGKLKEILPFAADYFKILEAESTMVYGNRELDTSDGLRLNSIMFRLNIQRAIIMPLSTLT